MLSSLHQLIFDSSFRCRDIAIRIFSDGQTERIDGQTERIDGQTERIDGQAERIDGQMERIDGGGIAILGQ